MRNFCKKFSGIVFLVLILAFAGQAGSARAQGNAAPALPEPLQNLAGEGAQMRYLGTRNGLDGWIAIKNGQEQYFYVTQDGQAFLMGLLFDKSGKVVTMQQVKALQEQAGGQVLDMFTGDDMLGGAQKQAQDSVKSGFDKLTDNTKREFKTPAEQLYDDAENSNWVTLGSGDAPYIYVFLDPQCPHCRAFMGDLRQNFIENGLLQVRMIPVGFKEETRSQSAFLLAVPDPQKRLFAFLGGDEAALPVTPGINQQGVQRNLSIMQSWKVNVTPFTIYRAKSGEVKIIQGRAHDIAQIVKDLR